MRVFAKPAATTNKLMRYYLCLAVSCLLVGVFLVQNTASSGALRSQSRQTQVRAAPRSLQLTTTLVAQEYCRNRVTKESQLDLTLKLSVKNISNVTLLICRYCNSIFRVVLSKSLRKAESGNYAYDQRSTMSHFPFPEGSDADQLSPEHGLFVTLKPGETFDYEYPQRIDITLTDADDPSENVSPGQYLLQVKIETWDWDEERFKTLEQRWAKYGSLWYWNIASEPLDISIEKPKSITTICKDP